MGTQARQGLHNTEHTPGPGAYNYDDKVRVSSFIIEFRNMDLNMSWVQSLKRILII